MAWTLTSLPLPSHTISLEASPHLIYHHSLLCGESHFSLPLTFISSWVLTGEVVTQYQEVISRPAMPPYWALGYHQSRNGFENLQQVKEVVSNFASNEVR